MADVSVDLTCCIGKARRRGLLKGVRTVKPYMRLIPMPVPEQETGEAEGEDKESTEGKEAEQTETGAAVAATNAGEEDTDAVWDTGVDPDAENAASKPGDDAASKPGDDAAAEPEEDDDAAESDGEDDADESDGDEADDPKGDDKPAKFDLDELVRARTAIHPPGLAHTATHPTPSLAP